MCYEVRIVTRTGAFDSYSALITFGENEITRSMDQDSFPGTDFNQLSAEKKAAHGNSVLKRHILTEGQQVVYVVCP